MAAGFSRPKFSFAVRTTHARQSFLLICRGSIGSTFSSRAKNPNLQSALLCQYCSSAWIQWLYRRFMSLICSGVKFSKYFTAATVATAHTGPELTFKNNLSPAWTCPKKLVPGPGKARFDGFSPRHDRVQIGLFQDYQVKVLSFGFWVFSFHCPDPASRRPPECARALFHSSRLQRVPRHAGTRQCLRQKAQASFRTPSFRPPVLAYRRWVVPQSAVLSPDRE